MSVLRGSVNVNSLGDSNIKVLHIAAGGIGIGAVKGAYELHQSLLGCGVNSRILMLGKDGEEGVLQCDWYEKEKSKEVRIIESHRNRKQGFICTGTQANLHADCLPSIEWADVIHIHFIGLGFSNIRDIVGIKKPKLITLRDMWFFTGLCNYSESCKKYLEECSACHLLGSTEKVDWSTYSHRMKMEFLSPHDDNIYFSAISKWILDTAKASSILKEKEISLINNGVNTSIFKRAPKKKNNILFVSANINNSRKGFDLFLEAIQKLEIANISITVVGKNSTDAIANFSKDIKTEAFEFIDDDKNLSAIYARAQVLAFASREEVFGKTITEAMSCGTPTVAFDIGGPSEIIVNNKVGVLVEPYDTYAFAKGLEWVLKQDPDVLAFQCRQRALAVFNQEKIVEKYMDRYSNILKESIANEV